MKFLKNKMVVCLLIIFGCVGLVYGLRFIKNLNIPLFEGSKGKSLRSKGNPKSSIKIVEYLDYQCPACAKGTRLLNDLILKNPEKLYLELKYYPLDMHVHGMRAARYAECASRQGKFWQVHEQLFLLQEQWKGLINAEPVFSEILKNSKIDPKKFDQCLADPTVSDLILKDKQEGTVLGVKSTPTYFINDKMIVGSLNLENELKILLENPVSASFFPK